MVIQKCGASEARERLRQGGCQVVDVREYPEFAEAHLVGSQLIPLGELRADPKCVQASGEVLLLCRTGRRALEAAELLRAAGGVDPVVIDGGLDAWIAAGYPVANAKGPISLERQVRIAAGALVLTGLLLNLVLPGAVFLSYFVGAGLIFAGITNSCAMGMLIARMPWNRRKLPRKPDAVGAGAVRP